MEPHELPAQLIVDSLMAQISQQAGRIAILEATIAHMRNGETKADAGLHVVEGGAG